MAKFWTSSRIQLGSYSAMTLALLAFLVVRGVASEQGVPIPWLPQLILPVVFFTTLATATASRLQLRGLIGLFLLALLLAFLARDAEPGVVLTLAYAAHFAFLLCTLWVILGHVFRAATVRPDVVLGSVCAYLLVGLLFNRVYGLIETLQPGSFRGLADIRRDGGYFSLVTLSTLGYGDVVPARAVARSFAVIEAIVGQFYIAVIVARLVAIRVAVGRGRATHDPAA